MFAPLLPRASRNLFRARRNHTLLLFLESFAKNVHYFNIHHGHLARLAIIIVIWRVKTYTDSSICQIIFGQFVLCNSLLSIYLIHFFRLWLDQYPFTKNSFIRIKKWFPMFHAQIHSIDERKCNYISRVNQSFPKLKVMYCTPNTIQYVVLLWCSGIVIT